MEDVFALIGFIIYLEIIELNFCKLNYNLRKYIIERSIEDSNTDIHLFKLFSIINSFFLIRI